MDFTSQDIAVIEQALQLAQRTSDGLQARHFQEVLAKLRMNAESAMSSLAPSEAMDGFRYDYDDSSDLS
ncbi:MULTISPECIES: hypothetical protein [Paenibacillus]|uniref:hypothetical protein n=1 Tax=Paenibacillus TaxID=44249 RepID=UPI0022B91228|nr:hypothetical protein [Paenibacillus caseinilyticus]MCZ8521498.1 hypothetical protein [Paenibacillus caseinilyticus]